MADVAHMMPHANPYTRLGGISTNHRDVTDDRYRDLRRPKKVRFYANGHRYFKGKRLHITPHRYLTFQDLLQDLTNKLPGNAQLPYGVRQIFTPTTGRRVREIEELQDGASYVCSGFETFKPIKYGTDALEPWNSGKTNNHGMFELDVNRSMPNRPHNAFQPSRTLRHSLPTRQQYGTFGARAGPSSYWQGPSYGPYDSHLNKPKVVTVIRNGTDNQSRSNVKILLNRRSVQSFEQLMRDIAEAFGPKWRNNKVRKLFNLKGREVQGVSDFFRDDEVFIGVGNDSLTTGDVQDILDELYPESPHTKGLMKEWEKTKKRYQLTTQYRKADEPRHDDKIDSGLGSEDADSDDIIYRGKGVDYHRPGKKKHKRPPPTEEDDNPLTRVEKERMRASEDEREKARKRMQKRLDAERRVNDEERRRRGLLPLKSIQNQDDDEPRTRRKKHRTPRRDSDEDPKVIVVVKESEDEGSNSPTRRKDEEDKEEEKIRLAEEEERKRKKKEEERYRKKKKVPTATLR